jgi:uncharacterized protein YndB with AHSA1/START domain
MAFELNVFIASKPENVFNAINQHLHDWWGETDHTVNAVDDVFTTQFKPTRWMFKVTEFVPNERIVWECIEAFHVHTGMTGIEKEWLGTRVVWSMSAAHEGTRLHFRHDGLTPDLNCYEVCSPAWEMFVTQSLKQFVETGKGMPAYF